MRGAKWEMKTTKKAFLNTIVLTAMKTHGINDSTEADNDVGDIPFLTCKANFLLAKVSRFERTIRFNNRILS